MAKRILVTGAFGQIGSELIPVLQKKYGEQNVVAMGHHNMPKDFDGLLEKAAITDKDKLGNIIEKYDITDVYHLVSILSAKGEKDPHLTWKVNMDGLKYILDLAVEYKLKIFWPSSIAVFGPTTPRVKTPQKTILEPTTMYGITKLAGEALCHYYFLKFGVDVRSVRFPGIISWKMEPGGGTTDFAVTIFYEALKRKQYTCFIRKNTVLPMMYMDDAISATLKIMDCPATKLTVRTSYNLAAISFSAGELAEEIKKHIPLDVVYQPDARQKIADSWPQSIDDSFSRKDWGWKHTYDLTKMTRIMLKNLKSKLGKEAYE